MKILFFLFAWLSFAPLHASDDPLRQVAEELANGIARTKNATVAVLVIPQQDKRVSDGSLFVSERLATYLAEDKRFVVVERQHMESLLKELHLSETGLLDARAAERVGHLLEANVIVTGTLVDLNNKNTELNVRGVSAGSGRVLVASRAVLERTWQHRPMMGW